MSAKPSAVAVPTDLIPYTEAADTVGRHGSSLYGAIKSNKLSTYGELIGDKGRTVPAVSLAEAQAWSDSASRRTRKSKAVLATAVDPEMAEEFQQLLARIKEIAPEAGYDSITISGVKRVQEEL